MSTPYLDTGFAMKRYVPEPNSPLAKVTLLAYAPPLILTDILEMELVNALNGKVFRRELSAHERDQCLADLQADIEGGFWIRCPLDPVVLRQRVISLSRAHTSTLGTRTLDLLHVAAALELGADTLLTFDARQSQAAVAFTLFIRSVCGLYGHEASADHGLKGKFGVCQHKESCHRWERQFDVMVSQVSLMIPKKYLLISMIEQKKVSSPITPNRKGVRGKDLADDTIRSIELVAL